MRMRWTRPDGREGPCIASSVYGMLGGMTDAFLLGAGFSRSIADTMPLTYDLGRRSIDQVMSVHGAVVLPDQHSAKCDGLSCDGLSPLPTFLSKALDFEEWLSSLAEAQPFHLPPENARRQALFSELTGSIAWVIDTAVAMTTEGHLPPGWLSQLVMDWHARRTQVVTFNYDTLIEATLDHLDIPFYPDKPDNRERVNHNRLGPTIIPAWNVMWGGLRLSEADTFRLLKLHGSTHWYWDDVTKSADSIVQIGLRHLWNKLAPEFSDDERQFRAPGKVPMIVPPITVKGAYFGNVIIRHLWHSAYMALGTARRIFVFGYSLPPGDTLVRSMLAELLSNKEVWIINPEEEVAKRFAELRPSKLVRDFVGACDPDAFVAAYLASHAEAPSIP